ncbi:BA14K family protein [Bradyrhizobium sp. SZCCHNS2002]|uniref:BA14K family protein n=1 Tax=unclassified Bradyrhizobium TaxID=2631580 RepID=UPI003967A59F
MPIGVTAAGNMVFPFACKDLIARHRGTEEASAPSESKAPPASSAAVAASPGKDALKASQAATVQPQQTGPENKRTDMPQQNDMGPRMSRRDRPGCLHFRSYDPKSETYLDYSGRRQPCRS